MIEAGAETSQFLQTLKCKGKKTTLYYKDPKIHRFDDELAKRLFEKDHPGVNIGQIRNMEDEFRLLKEQGVMTSAQPAIQAPEKKKILRPKEKGLMIKKISDASNSDRHVTRYRSNTDRRNKGKKKVEEP